MHVVIIGGGFAGAACALHLLRDNPALQCRLTMIEPRATLGAGLAYSSPAPEHRTNVAAARMSVLPEHPTHFHDWLLAQGDPARDPASALPDGRLYPARAVFGRYVNAQLRDQLASHPGVVFRHIRQEAARVEAEGDGLRVTLEADDAIPGDTPSGARHKAGGGEGVLAEPGGHDGGTLHADAVVLAVSHSAPDLPRPLQDVPAVLADPWDVPALDRIPAAARVLIVGTGLTACDVAARLLARNHAGPLTMISRHGLLPRPRTPLPVQAEGDFTTAPETTALGLLRRVRGAMAEAIAHGRPWENVVDALRQQSAAAWGTLDWPQRRALLRHLRTWWDVHRFQSAPQIDAALADAQATGRLRVLAGRLLGVSGATVTLRPRNAPADAQMTADVIVACTGPGHRTVVAAHPVLRGLFEAGALQPDPAALGIWVDSDSRVLRADGSAWRNLFVAGPLARGTFGELMGLPQVNLQPRDVAGRVAGLQASKEGLLF